MKENTLHKVCQQLPPPFLNLSASTFRGEKKGLHENTERVLRTILKETWRHLCKVSKVIAMGFLANKYHS